MKTRLLTPLALLVSALCAQGIERPDTCLWTLERCITHALANNLSVKARDLAAEQGRLAVTEARDAYLPTLSANASQNFSFGRSLNSLNVYDDMNTSTFSWGANLGLPLFQGLRAWRTEKAARADLRTLLEQAEATRDDVTLNVMAAYLQALCNGELLGVAREQERLSRVELERRQALLDAGRIAEVEVLEAKAQLASDGLATVDADNAWRLSMIELAQLLELEWTPAFAIAPVEECPGGIVPEAAEVYANALRHNHALAAGRLAVDAAGLRVGVARTGWMPTLSFNLGAGSSSYHLNGVSNEPFGAQMRHNYSTGLGLTLNVPIFDGFATRNAVRRARVGQVSAEIEYAQARDAVFKAIELACQQAAASGRRLEASGVAVESAGEAFRAMQVKYEAGRANATELEQAKGAYVKALSQQVQARYELELRRRIVDFYNSPGCQL